MIRSRRGARRHNVETAELNITAFMNLMVILVPFLLITAVFSRLAILELNLPGSSTEPADPQDLTFQLEVIVRTDKIEVGDRVQATRKDRVIIYEVTGLIEKRVSAARAAECVVDHSPPPPAKTTDFVDTPAFAQRDRGAGRPTKRDRRMIDKLRGERR